MDYEEFIQSMTPEQFKFFLEFKEELMKRTLLLYHLENDKLMLNKY